MFFSNFSLRVLVGCLDATSWTGQPESCQLLSQLSECVVKIDDGALVDKKKRSTAVERCYPWTDSNHDIRPQLKG